jgi:hypothetical protein
MDYIYKSFFICHPFGSYKRGCNYSFLFTLPCFAAILETEFCTVAIDSWLQHVMKGYINHLSGKCLNNSVV